LTAALVAREHPSMAEIPLAESLKRLPIFAALDVETLQRIAAGSRARRFDTGEPVFLESEIVRGFFAVVSGTVRIFRVAPDGREQVLQRVRGGQTFAEAAVLSMKRYPANAVAVEPTELVEIGAETFQRLFEGDPKVAKAMVASLSTWLLRLVGRVEELTVLSAGARLARHLLDLPSSMSGEGSVIALPMAKKDLAGELGITPETLSRLLRKWQDLEIVRTEGSSIVVLDADSLLAIAEDLRND
jgi:CRP/FNR family transcriptional regulator, dissimilatory nitrate respiration regulator